MTAQRGLQSAGRIGGTAGALLAVQTRPAAPTEAEPRDGTLPADGKRALPTWRNGLESVALNTKVFFHVFWARSTAKALMSCSINKETMATHTELPRELPRRGLIVNKQPDDVRLIY